MISLRPHQEDFIKDLRSALREHQSILACAPTGFGKTIAAAFMAKSAASKRFTIMFAVHRQELIDQTSASFTEAEIKHGFVAAGYPQNPHNMVKVVSINTLKNRLDKIAPPKLFIVDEAHHCAAAGWSRVVQWAKDGGAKIVGLTATPWRLSGEGLDQHFGAMIKGPSVAWLIEQGFLSDYRAFAPSTPSMAGVHVRAGDYVRSEIEEIMDDQVLIGDVVLHYLKHARGRKGLVFCVSVQHSEKVARRFHEAGVSAYHLDGQTPKDERRRAVRAYADGHIDVLTNVELFGEGFDLSSLAGRDVPIECVSLLRPTMSLSLHLQQLGRALRPKEQPAIILDHAGNMMRHGFPDDPFEWSLAPRQKNKRGNGKEPAIDIRQCEECYFVHRTAPVCPNCGHVYEIKYRTVDEVDGDLGEIDVRQRRLQRNQEQAGAKSLASLIELGKMRGYRHPAKWAAHVWTARARVKRTSRARV
jgi:superfamily II DNA or RNA helicase|tara:strand:- start:575 stop:1990 length:1416 start_codon:yes stop_codon:yes gene_type:complete